MPILLPNLDDRRYADLVDEALALIPVYAPEWTNHNASDPGITLIELFAYLTEMLIYRLNRITVENRVAFLNLIDIDAGKRNPDHYRDPNTLNEEVRNVISKLRRPSRAVTAEDYETLVLEKFSQEIARACSVPGRNLEPSAETTDAPGDMSVVVVPKSDALSAGDIAGLLKKVKDYLEPLRLLTTIVHVVEPSYVEISVQLTLHLEPDAVKETVFDAATKALRTFFNPVSGGRDGKGWPFGRSVYRSEIIERLVHVRGVDYVTKTPGKEANALRAIRPADVQKTNEAIPLKPHQLVKFSERDSAFTVPKPKQGDLRA